MQAFAALVFGDLDATLEAIRNVAIEHDTNSFLAEHILTTETKTS